MFHSCYSVSVWGRTHTSLVREQTTSNTVFDSLGNCNAGEAADCCARIECANENLSECFWQLTDVHEDQDQGAQNVEGCHDWNNLFSNRCDTANATEENECSQNSNYNTNDQWLIPNAPRKASPMELD